jgi:hypothetical protein
MWSMRDKGDGGEGAALSMNNDDKANKQLPRAGTDANGGGHQHDKQRGGAGVSTYKNPPKSGSKSGSNNGSDSGSDSSSDSGSDSGSNSGSNSGSDSGENGGGGKQRRGRPTTWAMAGLTADDNVVNGGGRQRGRQGWPRKMWEGKGLTALLSHPPPFVIVVSPGRLGLALAIDSKGLARRQLTWVAPGREKRL